MAGISNTVKSIAKTKQFSYDIFFDGALLSSTRGSLIVELIKYFLYERQQIPLPVDELKNKVAHEENSDNLEAETDNNNHLSGRKLHEAGQLALKFKSANTKPPWSKSHLQDKKAKHLVTELTQLFDSLQKAFELCPEIEQVAIILGGTVMNPKESYVISFPPPCPDADSLPLMSCKRTLFQQIIGEDILGTMSTNLSPTSMMISVLAPRSCPVKGFVPKHFMRTPKTGAVISFNFHCNYLLPVCHDLTFFEDLEISGIEILGSVQKKPDSGKNRSRLSVDSKIGEHSFKENHMDSGLNSAEVSSGGENFLHPGFGSEINHKQTPQIKQLTKRLASPVVRSADVPLSTDSSQTGSDCIWYQSPIVIKGYRIKDVFHNAFTSC
ncbi:unnamed protein product [Candidula unifasciata]|uniref:Uncharacterized protein n=1 Tax=Candidula unifasciata TaxID=100452 RepID=A0A8S4A9T9_9EUPU|nr:unnamed protein product [Candidula unifasciata]